MREFTINKNDAGQRLDRFVGKSVPLLPESLLQKYIRLKRIKVNGKGSKRDVRLAQGDKVQLYINDEFFQRPSEDNAYLKINTPKVDILYEDENILLADKKPGVLCHSAGEWDYNTLIANIQADNGQASAARATIWVNMPVRSAPCSALALVLAEQTPMIFGQRRSVSRGIWMAKSWSD